MNKLNVASLEASKRLVDNGIVLETECYWHFNDYKYEWQLERRDYFTENIGLITAPSMAEVWRELPEYINDQQYQLQLWRHKGNNYCAYLDRDNNEASPICININPTDALIDLLVWLKGAGV